MLSTTLLGKVKREVLLVVKGVLLDNLVWYMNLVKKYFCQNGGKQVQHLILRIDSYENYITRIDIC